MTIATTEHDMGAFDQQDEQIVRYLGLNPNSPADRAMVAVCRAYDFDPVLKHVVVIPKGGVYVTRDGLLHVAHRSGQFDGMVVEQDPTLIDGEWTAKVSVYRKDMRHPFTYPGRYPVSGSNKQYAQEMALKAAEAHALRRAFDVTGLPALDEDREGVRASTSGLATALATEQPEQPGLEHDEVAPAVEAETLLDTTSKLAKAMYAAINAAGITEPERLPFIASVVGHEVASSKQLTEDEARAILKHLESA